MGKHFPRPRTCPRMQELVDQAAYPSSMPCSYPGHPALYAEFLTQPRKLKGWQQQQQQQAAAAEAAAAAL